MEVSRKIDKAQNTAQHVHKSEDAGNASRQWSPPPPKKYFKKYFNYQFKGLAAFKMKRSRNSQIRTFLFFFLA